MSSHERRGFENAQMCNEWRHDAIMSSCSGPLITLPSSHLFTSVLKLRLAPRVPEGPHLSEAVRWGCLRRNFVTIAVAFNTAQCLLSEFSHHKGGVKQLAVLKWPRRQTVLNKIRAGKRRGSLSIHTTVAQVSKPPWVLVWFTVVRQILWLKSSHFNRNACMSVKDFTPAGFASRLCELQVTNKKLLELHSKWLLCDLCFAHYYTIDNTPFLPAKFRQNFTNVTTYLIEL